MIGPGLRKPGAYDEDDFTSVVRSERSTAHHGPQESLCRCLFSFSLSLEPRLFWIVKKQNSYTNDSSSALFFIGIKCVNETQELQIGSNLYESITF